ncbi:YdhK family protein [Mechercharimyces sp. CAU 1602]|uniref:YdhK family protein n=1 Tax=Mechercharimyces sp. CAU 1602 TaxID=2973933 RepID=UPI002162D920|nr:YdhK family protein [Mechercharimyces sp. CAU 1602]MCS1352109.1 YdhK family protein [Mechercharimyces sp. CAU 1602]
MNLKKIKYFMTILFLSLIFTLAACSGSNEEGQTEESYQNENQSGEATSEENTSEESDSHEDMDHSSSEVPGGLEDAENPTYEVGSQAIIQADHMSGMEGAEATIVGSYDTVAYVVSYDPTNGGKRVKNHKWVINEEIKEYSKESFKSGEEVTLNASHMKGMEGAIALIESVEETTVYMVDYTPTDGGKEVTNHKWITESELTAD